MIPWNNWYHCTGSTKGTWLRGDPRGWRARHHREHCVGDYKSPPPPEMYADLLALSQKLSKRRVILTRIQREVACRVMAEALEFYKADVVDVCVGAKHWHVLARFRSLEPGVHGDKEDRSPRHLMGIAKKRSARVLSKAGLIDEGGVWAVRCRALPVRDRAHQINIARYIKAHVLKGAAVWSILKKKSK